MTTFWKDESGQNALEYSLLTAVLALALIASINQLSTAILLIYESITN